MRITTVIDEKEVIDLKTDNLIFIRGKAFKMINTDRSLSCILCCFHEMIPDGDGHYCNMRVCNSIKSKTISLCYSKITDGYNIMNISFKEIKISLFVARLIWKSIRKSK